MIVDRVQLADINVLIGGFWLLYLLQWDCGGEPMYPGWKLSCRGRNRSSCRGGCGLQMGVSRERHLAGLPGSVSVFKINLSFLSE